MGIRQILAGMLPFMFIANQTTQITQIEYPNSQYFGYRGGKSTRSSDYSDKKRAHSRKRNKISKQSRKINYA